MKSSPIHPAGRRSFVGTETAHSHALALMRRWRTGHVQIVTTNYVIAELTALLIRPLRVSFSHRVDIVETIRTAPWVEVVQVDPALDDEAWTLLKRHTDKDWNLVDCVSFIVLQRRGIAQALSRDHHFEQAGFERLLR